MGTRAIGRRLLKHGILSDRSGALILETAIVLPVFLLIVLGTVEWARFLWTRQAITHVADLTGRCYALNSSLCTGTNSPASFAVALAAKDGIQLTTDMVTAGSQPSCTSSSGGSIAYYTVSISYTFQSAFTALLSLPSGISSSSRYGC
jgi:Flp pilus assembly protein TadG